MIYNHLSQIRVSDMFYKIAQCGLIIHTIIKTKVIIKV
jgi:hypothetical protein